MRRDLETRPECGIVNVHVIKARGDVVGILPKFESVAYEREREGFESGCSG
jgi:hypothetical protein